MLDRFIWIGYTKFLRDGMNHCPWGFHVKKVSALVVVCLTLLSMGCLDEGLDDGGLPGWSPDGKGDGWCTIQVDVLVVDLDSPGRGPVARSLDPGPYVVDVDLMAPNGTVQSMTVLSDGNAMAWANFTVYDMGTYSATATSLQYTQTENGTVRFNHHTDLLVIYVDLNATVAEV